MVQLCPGTGAVSRGLASIGVEFSEEAVGPVTGYRVDLLLRGGEGTAMVRCAVEVGRSLDFAIGSECRHHDGYRHGLC
jgi:hypothetical protein